MSIVITGAAGFIGSCLVHHLNQNGIRSLVLVDEAALEARAKNLDGKHFETYLPKEELFPWLEGRASSLRAFIHLGACSDTMEQNAAYLRTNNTDFSIRLAQYALAHGKRFIYASSAATYGMGEEGFSDAHERLPSLRPLNLYGMSKHLFDLWLLQEGLLDRVVGLKYFNVFGPNEYHKGRMASALVRMAQQAREQGTVSLFKSNHPDYRDGEQQRDLLYVRDAVAMTAQFLNNEVCGIFNIGTGRPYSWNRLAEAMASALERPLPITYIDMPESLQGKYQNYTCADMGKYRAAGLCEPQYSLEEAVADYVRSYLVPGNYL